MPAPFQVAALFLLVLSLFSTVSAHSPSANQARHKALSRSRAHFPLSHPNVQLAPVIPAEPVKRVAPARRAVERSCAAAISSRSSLVSSRPTSSVSAARSSSAGAAHSLSSSSSSASVTRSASATSTSTASTSASAAVSQGNDGTLTVEVTSTSTRYTTVYSSPPSTATSTAATAATSAVSTVDPDGVGPFHGDATWFDTGLGACGWTNTPDDYIVAVSHLLFDAWPGYAGVNPNDNPICGQRARVTLPSAGTSVVVSIADRCVGCAERDLDFTSGAFTALVPGGLDVGRIGMTWEWI